MIKIPEWIAVDSLKRHINNMGMDELARLLGEIFGGECYPDKKQEAFNFKPDKFYSGEFDELKKTKKKKKIKIYERRHF